ncbi:MAG: Tex family protein [Candidatus Promineifilaceae bacterium]
MTHIEKIAAQIQARPAQVAAAVELLDAGNTLPFIARYRKEATGGLDEEQLRQLSRLLDSLRALDKRRQTILDSVAAQGQLTPELAAQLHAAATLTELEDLYQPYKPKRRTRATMARENGLQPLADLILTQPRIADSLERLAAPYLSESVPTAAEAWSGARDIVAEVISDHAGIRQQTRQKALQWGRLASHLREGAADEKRVFQTYYEFELPVSRLRPHQVLALNRGESEDVLRVAVEVAERDWRGVIGSYFRPHPRSPLAGQLEQAIADAAQRLLLPAIERDVRRALAETAETHAIQVFAANLRNLLAQPPLSGQIVMGIDPGFRTGCKVAVVDATGKVLDTATIYPHPPQRDAAAAQTLFRLAQRHGVTVIAIGNGTASRETEQFVAELLQTGAAGAAQYLMVNEASASVYSASELARAELPHLDVSMRGAVSIARRVQDPLAELVKIDPRSIGVGLYQHDVNQKQLGEALDGVVESVVNQVGVDVNTASPALLQYVAGIGPKLAQKIAAHRDENGPFPNRQALRQVAGLGPKAFEQAAGFLRVRQGDNPLDASAIHPESYGIAAQVLARAGLTPASSLAEREAALLGWQERTKMAALARELNAGIPTLADILEQLIRPGRDPRADLPAPILRRDVLSLEDLRVGMRLQGTVRNVVDFGAFVDIGVKQGGLLHRSQWPRHETFGVGDVIEVTILQVEIERGRISLGWGE